MDELDSLDEDETVTAVRGRGALPLPLEGWDQASTWGWDETTGSLYARLQRNTEDSASPPTIRIGSDDYTPAITWPETLAQHIAMATDSDPWEVLASLYRAADQDKGWREEHRNAAAGEGGTVVTMTERHGPPEWPYRHRRC